MIIPMDENEDFQHLEEMSANLQAKQKQILKGMLSSWLYSNSHSCEVQSLRF